MTTLFTTLAVILFILTVIFFVIGSILAFRSEFEKAIRYLDNGCLDTEANYRKVKQYVEAISRNPFRNRRKTDELLVLFYDKFKCSMYIDFKLDQANFYHRMVKVDSMKC